MQSTGLVLEPTDVTHSPGVLERLGGWDKVPMAFGCGCLLGLSTPGFDLWWLAWVGLVPLLVLLRAAASKVEAGFTGFTFGVGYYLVALNWLLGLYPLSWLGLDDFRGFVGSVLVWILAASLQASLVACFSLLLYVLPLRAGFLPGQARPYAPYLVAAPVLWVFSQWVIGTLSAFPVTSFATLSLSQGQELPFIQLARISGSQLLDFCLVCFNAGIAALIIELTGVAPRFSLRGDRVSPRAGAFMDLAIIVFILGLALIWGNQELGSIGRATDIVVASQKVPPVPPVPVAVLQGNVSVEEERLGASIPKQICSRYVALGCGLGVALVILPEGVIGSSERGPGMLLSQLEEIASMERKEVVTGILGIRDHGCVNAAGLISPCLTGTELYVKQQLVPFGEYLPPCPLNQMLPSDIKRLLPQASGGFVPGGMASLLNSVWGKIGASICVEVTNPRLIAAEVRRGASLLVNVSNLAWFHNSSLMRKILAAAQMRAVENGRYLILSTNTGISAVIDPAGLVTSASLPGKRGILLDTVQFLYRRTPFTKMWWL